MSKQRVVVTGAGIVSCIGNDLAEVDESLREGRSGIRFGARVRELGLRSQVGGKPEIDLEARIDRKQLRFMGDAAAYAILALKQAIAQRAWSRTGVATRAPAWSGSGGGSSQPGRGGRHLRAKGIKRVGPYHGHALHEQHGVGLPGHAFKIKGVNYSITSACATSAHCIGNGRELIAWGSRT
jgi:3-oxoacyl-[acyl-carrier-protein] synthase-1